MKGNSKRRGKAKAKFLTEQRKRVDSNSFALSNFLLDHKRIIQSPECHCRKSFFRPKRFDYQKSYNTLPSIAVERFFIIVMCLLALKHDAFNKAFQLVHFRLLTVRIVREFAYGPNLVQHQSYLCTGKYVQARLNHPRIQPVQELLPHRKA